MSADEPVVVLCTAPDEQTAARLARGLVEARLAACVNVITGVRSFYRWQGKVEDDAEVQMLIKSRRGRAAELEAFLSREHPHDVPEILFLPIDDGSAPYLEWLHKQTI